MQVQRLQRYATYGHLKQLVLRLIADDVVALSEEMSDKVMALRQAPLILLPPICTLSSCSNMPSIMHIRGHIFKNPLLPTPPNPRKRQSEA